VARDQPGPLLRELLRTLSEAPRSHRDGAPMGMVLVTIAIQIMLTGIKEFLVG